MYYILAAALWQMLLDQTFMHDTEVFDTPSGSCRQGKPFGRFYIGTLGSTLISNTFFLCFNLKPKAFGLKITFF